jgi:signal transduction histidine kinase/CheY-like chemotaxis protein
MAEAQRPGDSTLDFLLGGGEMGALMRAHDWSRTPLGAAATWPQSLRTAVSVMLNSRYPMFIAWGPELVFLYNDAYRPIFGTKHPASVGRPFADIWSEIWTDLVPLIDRAMAGEATWSDDLQLFMERSGYLEEVYFTFSYSPIRDESGGVGGMFCACTETTGKVLGERRMRCLRDLAAAAEAKTVEHADSSCLRVLERYAADIPFALLYRGQAGAAAKLVGAANASPSTATAPWPLERAFGGEIETIDELPSRLVEAPRSLWGDPVRTALVLPMPDRWQTGATAALVLGINPRRALDKDYRSFLTLAAGSVATAAANARAFDEEHRRAEALAELDRAKTMFFSNVSHEFRTPLTLMLGPLEEALGRPSIIGQLGEGLTIAHRNGLRLLKLVNTLLDFSRVEAGRIQAVYHATELATFTANLASNFRSACERAGLRLIIDCPPLQEAVYVDREMWEKIVLNLLSNAFKFTFSGEIAVSIRAADGHAELAVRDTGTGIPAAELPRIFERFHRVADTQGRTHEGSGIGLALVQELMKLHGGSVQVASTQGVGTTFTVRVPFGTAHLSPDCIGGAHAQASTATRAEAYVEEALRWLPDEAEAPTIAGAAATEPHAAPGGARQRVLLADDNADMRDYLKRLLVTRYDVDAVGDGRAALDAVRVRRPDLVLSDVMMPQLDGFAFLKELRADPELRDVPVLLLSARAGEEAKVQGLEAGADDYLVKPFSARELLTRVRTNIDLARLRSEAARARSG